MADNEPVDDWLFATSGGEAFERLAAELNAELSPGHQLWGLAVDVIARRISQDDILVTAAGKTGCAVVHLTYAKNETAPWPRIHWFETPKQAFGALAD